MALFGPPKFEKLKAEGNVPGLLKALGYWEDSVVRQRAADALGQIGDARAVEPLMGALKDKNENWDVHGQVPPRFSKFGAERPPC